MKSILIAFAFIGLAFGSAIEPKEGGTLPEAIEEIGSVFNSTAVREIVAWYAENDDEVIAIVNSLGSDNFRQVIQILDKTPEFVYYIHWIDSTGIPVVDAIRSWNERFDWGLDGSEPQKSIMTDVSTKSWRSMIDEIREIIDEEALEQIQEVIVELLGTNDQFHEFVGRTLAIQPLFQELNETPEFLAVGGDFRDLGVDVDLALNRTREYFEWLESVYN